MTVSLKISSEIRDRLHNSNDQEFYKASREYFITTNEDFVAEAEEDIKHNVSIGYGFNMQRDEARGE